MVLFNVFSWADNNLIEKEKINPKLQEIIEQIKDSNLDKIKTLVNSNTIHLTNKMGRTPLHIACYQGKIEIANLLISKGAIVNLPDKAGWTPLHDAIYSANIKLVKLLLANKADVNEKTNLGRTALHLAVVRSLPDMVKLFVENKADIDSSDINDWTPLLHAVSKNLNEIAKYLVLKGADISIKNSVGRTSLHIASQEGNLELIELFLKNKAKINTQDYSYISPKRALDLAKDKKTEEFLINKGAIKGRSIFKNALEISPSFQYSAVVTDNHITSYGINVKYYSSNAFSFYWSFYYGKGEDDFEYFHMPGNGIILHSFATLVDKNYSQEATNPSTLFSAFLILSAIIPEGFSFHYPINHWIVAEPYFSLANIEYGKKDEVGKMYMGMEAGVRLNFMPIDRLQISPYGAFEIMWISGGDTGFNFGFNLGYVF